MVSSKISGKEATHSVKSVRKVRPKRELPDAEEGYFYLSRKEKLINVGGITVILLVLARLFFGHVFFAAFLIPVGIAMYRNRQKQILKKRKESFETQFKDFLVSLSDGVATGYSIENAVAASYRDVANVHGAECDMCREIRTMVSEMKLNMNTEEVFLGFAARTGLGSARTFAQIYSVARHSGGNLVTVIKSVTDDIVMKEEVKEEIKVEISSRQLEQKVMLVIPPAVIIYVGTASKGFLDVMYQTLMGKLVMAVCLLIYVTACFWSEKITDIEI